MYWLFVWNIKGNNFAILIQNIIDKNSKKIIDECQQYLNLYSQGIKPVYSTNIDYLIEKLNEWLIIVLNSWGQDDPGGVAPSVGKIKKRNLF